MNHSSLFQIEPRFILSCESKGHGLPADRECCSAAGRQAGAHRQSRRGDRNRLSLLGLKAELWAEIVATVSAREVGIAKAVADADGSPVEKLQAAVRTFASRALRGRRLAYALIAEPVDPEVETVR